MAAVIIPGSTPAIPFWGSTSATPFPARPQSLEPPPPQSSLQQAILLPTTSTSTDPTLPDPKKRKSRSEAPAVPTHRTRLSTSTTSVTSSLTTSSVRSSPIYLSLGTWSSCLSRPRRCLFFRRTTQSHPLSRLRRRHHRDGERGRRGGRRGGRTLLGERPGGGREEKEGAC